MRRPKIILAWALFFAIAAMLDIANVIRAYAVQGLDYLDLNPGALAVFRPIAWLGALLVPLGLWFMRRWAVYLYLLLQLMGVSLVLIIQPQWMSSYPAWAIPASLVFSLLFLMTILPQWKHMVSKVP